MAAARREEPGDGALRGRRPREVTAVVCSTQHAEEVGRKALTEGVLEEVVGRRCRGTCCRRR